MRVVVTGALGLVGTAVVDDLSRNGHDVQGLDRATGAPAPSLVATRDLSTRDGLESCFVDCDAVVHLAAIPRPWKHPDSEVFTNNTVSTFNVLDAAASAGVGTAVIASSISILGLVWGRTEQAPIELPITEQSRLQIRDPYALSKHVDEAIGQVVSQQHGMTVLAYRFPDMGDPTYLSARAAAIVDDPSIGLRELWGYLSLTDAARAVRLGLESTIAGFHVVNVCADSSLGGIDVQQHVRSTYPSTRFTREIAPGASAYDTSLARQLIAFEATPWDHLRDIEPPPSVRSANTNEGKDK